MMTKKFFSLISLAHNAKMLSMFTLGTKKGNRKNKNTIGTPALRYEQHWTAMVSNSWCVSLLQDTIPCLERYKRGVKHVYDTATVDVAEVQACISIMYGSLLKLYPRGSKTPIFSARVNIACRVRELLHQSQATQMEFIKTHSSLMKLCLMEYCYNVLQDFLPVENSFIVTHPCMQMYHVTAQ
jgi:hypothetical protein